MSEVRTKEDGRAREHVGHGWGTEGTRYAENGGDMEDEKIRDAVLKVALGFSVEEVTEEYGVEDGELRLVKRKETRKDVPPDLRAVKLLMEGTDVSALSDEELEAEKARLLRELERAGAGNREEI